MEFEQITAIQLPDSRWQEILVHCRRKFAQDYLPGETEFPRAYGLIAGRQSGDTLQIERIFPVKKNARSAEPFKSIMDNIMGQHAIPSKTPLDRRGWITDPAELKTCYQICDRENIQLFGTYHMHVIAWDHDPIRDTPTFLDTILAKKTNAYQFIISLVDDNRPLMRAFYEGEKEKETVINIQT